MTLLEAVADLAARARILVVSDFDGTIAPIVSNPSDARPDPRAVQALRQLSTRSGVDVAILSGRPVAELFELAGPLPGVTLIGEHGSDPGQDDHPLPSVVDDLVGELQEIADDVPGSWIEVKRWSVAFHYRNAREAHAEMAVRRLMVGPAQGEGVVVRHGKKVVELHLTSRSKGDAVTEMIEGTGAEAVLYIGDDVTDETVFSRLQPDDVGVKVGQGETAASYRVADIGEVVELLKFLAQRRNSLPANPV